jgi:signal transduction histidine kinase/ligand-binding sensor domain-containing protein
MKNLIIKLLFLYLFTCPLYGQSYEPLIKKITDLKGNSAGGTFSIVEDPDGFIWFGTVEGLYRFDGYNFKKYVHSDSDETSLSSNTIRALCIQDRNLWIGTQGGGLNCLNIDTDEITKYIHTGESTNEISHNSIWSLLLDSKNNLWIGFTETGFDKLNLENREFTNFDVFTDLNVKRYETTCRALFEDSEGFIWAGISNYAVISLDPKTGTFKTFTHTTSETIQLTSNSILGITEDNQNRIYISTYGGGINIYDKQTNSFSYITHEPNNQNSLISDLCYGITNAGNGIFWIPTEYGISVWNSRTGKFENYSQNACIENSISDNRVRSIFIDSNEIIWIGTESDVDMIIQQKNFLTFKNSANKPNSLPKGIVRAILEDSEQNLWFGLIDYGLIFYDTKKKTFTRFTKFKSDHYFHEKKHITALYQDSEGDIWLGEWDSGLYKLNKKTKVFEQIAGSYPGSNKLTGTRIQKISELYPGFLLIGTESGLNLLDIKQNKTYQYVHDPENNQSIRANGVQSNALVADSKGNLWVGVWSGGLNKLKIDRENPELVSYKNWMNDPQNPKGLSNDNVISLYAEDSILWIGTFGGGLSKFSIKDETFRHFTTSDGLPNNIIFSIIQDRQGYLWLSTDGGLSRFDPESEKFKNYYKSDGLQSDHFFWGSSHKGESGQFYFGGINGINSFYPDSILEKKIKTPIVLLSLQIFDKEYKNSISDSKKIELKHNENFLTFEFAALNYVNPHHVVYYYMIEGIDENWINNGNRRFANYTDLRAGRYFFKVKISQGDISEATDEYIMEIIIHPPWWAAWWARTLTLLILIGAVIGFYYLRLGFLERQKRILKELVEKRTYEINQSKEALGLKNIELTETLSKLEIAQKKLIESEKMASIGIMSAGIAHEINNPLNFISVSIENIKLNLQKIQDECQALTEEQAELLSKLITHSETGVGRISQIIKSLKIYSHKGEGKMKAVQLKSIIESSITILQSKIPDRLNFKTSYEDIRDIRCKPDEISQVILNLIDNAIDAVTENSKGQTELAVDLKKEDLDGKEYILTSIYNSGKHIEESRLKHIFDPFYTTKSPNKGTGLGLYISYTIINDHNGVLKVENCEEGVKFLIYLPLN